ncbi:MAG: RNA polymerase sigma factor [Thermodesulfobacteriota bacterium]|nr:RNA polymerase sigma factor [Thermodesulfobacteriota bacterium]
MINDDETGDLADKAVNGDHAAIEALVKVLQHPVYNMALKMLYLPSDAEDATQEILIKIVTHLSGFRHESSFKTWAYRIAANHLINLKKKGAKKFFTDFDSLKENGDQYLDVAVNYKPVDAEKELLIKEIRLSCLHGVLLYLSPEHRIAFIIGELLGATGKEAAEILEISEAAYRKRLSRARHEMQDFMGCGCGLISPSNPCRCEQLTGFALKSRWIQPDSLRFATHPMRRETFVDTLKEIEATDEMQRVAALYKQMPEFAAPEKIADYFETLFHQQDNT